LFNLSDVTECYLVVGAKHYKVIKTPTSEVLEFIELGRTGRENIYVKLGL